MLLKLYGISNHRFRSLKERHDIVGICYRTHGNKGRMPNNTLPYSAIADIQEFVTNYVKENGILLPGRTPGYKDDDIKLLSACESKMNVWRCYGQSC